MPTLECLRGKVPNQGFFQLWAELASSSAGRLGALGIRHRPHHPRPRPSPRTGRPEGRTRGNSSWTSSTTSTSATSGSLVLERLTQAYDSAPAMTASGRAEPHRMAAADIAQKNLSGATRPVQSAMGLPNQNGGSARVLPEPCLLLSVMLPVVPSVAAGPPKPARAPSQPS